MTLTTFSQALQHYRKLFFYAAHRYEGDNYQQMRNYFAEIVIREVEEFLPLEGKIMLDVGGGRGEFCAMFHTLRDCRAVNLDPMDANIRYWPSATRAYGDAIPLPNDHFDLVMSRGVFEHIPPQLRQASVNEMYRVTRPGGLCYIAIPPWFNPHAGHGLRPFHLLPFPAAKFLKRRLFGYRTKAKSYAGEGLYPLTYRGMARYIRAAGYELVATRDTHFRLHFMTYLPLAQETFVPVVAFIGRKPERG